MSQVPPEFAHRKAATAFPLTVETAIAALVSTVIVGAVLSLMRALADITAGV
jgi:ABC-type amino acid transport system permease subunit